jgi:hypothetical protein
MDLRYFSTLMLGLKMSSQKPTIRLHLGVHKTATTHIQSRLYNSRELLKQQGISYIGLNEVRQRVTSKLNEDRFGADDITEALQPFMNYDYLLLSDENIIGGTNKPKSNSFYPDARQRLEKLLRALTGHEIWVYLSIRSYIPYFISRYAESLRHFRFHDFDRYYEQVDFEAISWKDLIADIQAAGVHQVTVADFKSQLEREEAYLAMLTGGRGIALAAADENPSIRRARFSQQGYEVVRYFAWLYGPSSTKKIMAVLDNTRQETRATPFMPFSEEQQTALSNRYNLELNELRDIRGAVASLAFFDPFSPSG